MPIDPKYFFEFITRLEVDFFTGVPDSLLKEFCLCVDDNISDKKHVITANEGNAIALATGYHLATGKLPLVYMQNSGLGNAINPILSLCDPDVYSIPMILLIGWRGEPGVKDEPQHVKQGKIQLGLLEVMDIPYTVLSNDDFDIEKKISNYVDIATKENRPVAIIIKKGTFDNYRISLSDSTNYTLMSREESLEIILNNLPENSIVVSTTGKTSREIHEIRRKKGQSHKQDFLTVGSMGHCSSIALGIALNEPKRNVVCIDGDGSLIMHMGSLSTVGKLQPKNFYHILINNQVHDSVGGQETAVKFIDIPSLAKSNGYQNIISLDNKEELSSKLIELFNKKGPCFMEINVKSGARNDLGRPTQTPLKNKELFMGFIKGEL